MRSGARVALALVLLGLAACDEPPGDVAASPPRAPARGPSLILISLDTLAATHLGGYGYHRDTSPNLDAWARDATLFENAFSTAPKTAESHMSMFTSLYPSVHGVRTVQNLAKAGSLSGEQVSVVEILRAAGYRTVGIHGSGNVAAELGFERGFDAYRSAGKNRGRRVVMDWLGAEAGGDPFFLFFHTYFVHDPYLAAGPEPGRFSDPGYRGPIPRTHEALSELAEGDDFRARHEAWWATVDRDDPAAVAHVVDLYDDRIAIMDDRLGSLFESIAAHAPEAIVIVVSDHGEEFGQHGQFTHEQIYGEVLRVPLVIRHPEEGRGRRVAAAVSTIDLAPTILDLLGLPSHPQFQGRSLAPFLSGAGRERPVFAEFGSQRATWIEGGKKLAREGLVEELYDLGSDPEEQLDLLRTDRDAPRWAGVSADWERLRVALDRQRAENRAAKRRPAAATLSDQTREQLEALGYIDR